jgi:hypothetical protein
LYTSPHLRRRQEHSITTVAIIGMAGLQRTRYLHDLHIIDIFAPKHRAGKRRALEGTALAW